MADCDVCIGGLVDDHIEGYECGHSPCEADEKCLECNEAIAVGQVAELSTGEDWRAVTCLLCAEIREVFSCGEDQMHGTLWDDMAEHAFPELTTASKCFTGLSAAAKQRVIDKWNEWKFAK